jgi:hypothetical protein
MTEPKPNLTAISIHKIPSTLRSGTAPLVTFTIPPAIAASYIATGSSFATAAAAALRQRRVAAGRAG